MSEPVLVAAGLTFGYSRRRRVLEGLDWAVAPGERTLLLGPNGAGKSTLLKLLCGLERPDSGTVSVSGDRRRRALYDAVGWMPQEVRAGRGLRVEEQVEYAAWVGGASRRQARDLARAAISAVGLEGQRDERTDRLSGGQLRRVGLAQAVVRRAPVLLLDEPTAGLDPAQAENFRRLLGNLECPGGIVVSTHQVSDLAAEVDRVVVLADGRIRFDGTVDGLRNRGGSGPVSVVEAFAEIVGGGAH